jgi:hypothetical protein
VGLAAVLALGPSAWASAQEDEEEVEAPPNPEEGDTGEEEDEEGEDEGEDEEGEDEGDESEEGEAEAGVPAERSWYFGPYFRFVFVPAFMLELFLDESPTVANYRSGPDKPTFQIGIGYTGYGFEDPFLAKGDPIEDTEWVESDLALVHLTGSILWNAELVEKKLFFEYGVGLDIGVVLGEMVRTEAYIESATGKWRKCGGVGNPAVAIAYCEPGPVPYDEEGAHYNVVEERVPPVAALPMVPHLTLRYDPIPEVAVKLELAYGIFQMWFGLSAYYAPKI